MQKTNIRTASGQPIWYLYPEKTQILLEDIYAGQRNIRYSGQNLVSIMQHSAICTGLSQLYGYSVEEIAYCAAHDLHESYINDLPKGLKEVLPDYCAIEEKWEARVHTALGFTWPPTHAMQEKIKHVDIRALCVEMWIAGWDTWEPAINVANWFGGLPTSQELAVGNNILKPPAPIGTYIWKIILNALDNHIKHEPR